MYDELIYIIRLNSWLYSKRSNLNNEVLKTNLKFCHSIDRIIDEESE